MASFETRKKYAVLSKILALIFFTGGGILMYGKDPDGNFMSIFSIITGIVFLIIPVRETKTEKILRQKVEIVENRSVYKDEYLDALKSTDKELALKLGRRYYSSLREDSKLTTYDEKAIEQEINSMK